MPQAAPFISRKSLVGKFEELRFFEGKMERSWIHVHFPTSNYSCRRSISIESPDVELYISQRRKRAFSYQDVEDPVRPWHRPSKLMGQSHFSGFTELQTIFSRRTSNGQKHIFYCYLSWFLSTMTFMMTDM